MTKDKIGKTFIELTRTRSADKITVKDIVDTCGVTRQTFYYHFQDIEDVIDWIFTSSMEAALEKVSDMADMSEATYYLVQNILENGDIIGKLFNSKRHQHVEATLSYTVRVYLKSNADKMNLYSGFSEYEEKIAIDLYSYAVTGVLLEHIESRTGDVRAVTNQIHALLTGELAKRIHDNFMVYIDQKDK